MVPAVAAVCRQPKAAPACSSYELPITREELGDTLGLSTVPCEPNAATALRAENLITLKSGHVVILDQDRLFEFSGFNPNYLHPAHRRGGQSNKDTNSGNLGHWPLRAPLGLNSGAAGTKPQILGYPMLTGWHAHERRGWMATRRVHRRDKPERLPRLDALFAVLSVVL